MKPDRGKFKSLPDWRIKTKCKNYSIIPVAFGSIEPPFYILHCTASPINGRTAKTPSSIRIETQRGRMAGARRTDGRNGCRILQSKQIQERARFFSRFLKRFQATSLQTYNPPQLEQAGCGGWSMAREGGDHHKREEKTHWIDWYTSTAAAAAHYYPKLVPHQESASQQPSPTFNRIYLDRKHLTAQNSGTFRFRGTDTIFSHHSGTRPHYFSIAKSHEKRERKFYLHPEVSEKSRQ